MKKLLLGTVAAIMLTGAAQACDLSKFGPQNVFNKVELTEFDKCWLDNHAVKNYGIDGSVFWIKTNGQYFSAPIKHIRDLGVEKWIEESVMTSLESTSEEIVKLTKLVDLRNAAKDSDVEKYLSEAVENAKRDIESKTNVTIDLHGEGFDIVVNNQGNMKSLGSEMYGSGEITKEALMSEWVSFTIQDITTALEDAYDQGYSDGYEAGYADGYAQGYADGSGK